MQMHTNKYKHTELKFIKKVRTAQEGHQAIGGLDVIAQNDPEDVAAELAPANPA